MKYLLQISWSLFLTVIWIPIMLIKLIIPNLWDFKFKSYKWTFNEYRISEDCIGNPGALCFGNFYYSKDDPLVQERYNHETGTHNSYLNYDFSSYLHYVWNIRSTSFKFRRNHED